MTNDKKILLLQTGQEIFAAHGFANVGLTELLKKAGIPKGSFYYYFKSKEQYGVEVIEYYIQEYTIQIKQLFDNNAISGKDRLLTYWQKWHDTQSINNYEGRCLIVKLSSEVTDFSEAMRHAFCIGTEKILDLIITVIKCGQQDQSIPHNLNPQLTAHQLYQQWLGASLLTKIQKNGAAFETAFHYTHSLLKI